MVEIDWIQIVDPPEAAICVKTFTIFYGRNWKYQSPRCIPTSVDEEFQFPCTGFRNRTRHPSANISHIRPIYLDICGESHRDIHVDITPIGRGEDDGEEDDKLRDIQEKPTRITNETARIFLQLNEQDVPPCDPQADQEQSERPLTYHWATFFGVLLACAGVLNIVFILFRHYQVQKKKLELHAWRGWKLVEPVKATDEEGDESLSNFDEIIVQEAETTSNRSVSDNEHVKRDNDTKELQLFTTESHKISSNLAEVKETDEFSSKSTTRNLSKYS